MTMGHEMHEDLQYSYHVQKNSTRHYSLQWPHHADKIAMIGYNLEDLPSNKGTLSASQSVSSVYHRSEICSLTELRTSGGSFVRGKVTLLEFSVPSRRLSIFGLMSFMAFLLLMNFPRYSWYISSRCTIKDIFGSLASWINTE